MEVFTNEGVSGMRTDVYASSDASRTGQNVFNGVQIRINLTHEPSAGRAELNVSARSLREPDSLSSEGVPQVAAEVIRAYMETQ